MKIRFQYITTASKFAKNYLWIIILTMLALASCNSNSKKCVLQNYTVYKIMYVPCSDSVKYYHTHGILKEKNGKYHIGDIIPH